MHAPGVNWIIKDISTECDLYFVLQSEIQKDVYFNYSLQLSHKNSIQLNYFQPKYRNFTADVNTFYYFL